jgi:hypothetical protein
MRKAFMLAALGVYSLVTFCTHGNKLEEELGAAADLSDAPISQTAYCQLVIDERGATTVELRSNDHDRLIKKFPYNSDHLTQTNSVSFEFKDSNPQNPKNATCDIREKTGRGKYMILQSVPT